MTSQQLNQNIPTFARFLNFLKTNRLYILILILGVFARVWDFGNTPPGLNPDEASIGVEAYYLFKYGIDRNGISFPVHFISWGSGQNVLYAYLLIPFVALRGLNAETIRLPMMLTGILSLPLIHYVGDRLLGKKFALLAMFIVSVAPWHIVNTRWAVESNILPFIFLLGFSFLLASLRAETWFVPAMICFALALYSYGTTYIALPVFLLLSIPVLLYQKKISARYFWSGIFSFVLAALPIFIFVLVNTLHLDTIHLGSMTMPRLPVEARYESLAVPFDEDPLSAIADNILIMFNLLLTQKDAFAWNFVEPFGYFYTVTFPLVAAGFYFLVRRLKPLSASVEHWLLFSWLVASVSIGVVHPVNLTRLNLVFIPLLFLIALCVYELNVSFRYVQTFFVPALFIAFLFFNYVYHFGVDYRRRADDVFNAGIVQAIDYAYEKNHTVVCVSQQTRFAYIYTLFVAQYHPSTYINDIEWLLPEKHPLDPARSPRALGVFRFQLADCASDPEAIYVLKLKEEPSNLQPDFKIKRFGKYQVFLP